MIGTLTHRQAEVLDFIREMIDSRGWPPTIREIGENFDISSPNGVMCHLKALEKKGVIVRDSNTARSIRLTDTARPKRGMPLLELADLEVK